MRYRDQNGQDWADIIDFLTAASWCSCSAKSWLTLTTNDVLQVGTVDGASIGRSGTADLMQDSASHPVKPPTIRHALQLVLACALVPQIGPRSQILHLWDTRMSDGPARAATARRSSRPTRQPCRLRRANFGTELALGPSTDIGPPLRRSGRPAL
jgi:hypothetical protein